MFVVCVGLICAQLCFTCDCFTETSSNESKGLTLKKARTRMTSLGVQVQQSRKEEMFANMHTTGNDRLSHDNFT